MPLKYVEYWILAQIALEVLLLLLLLVFFAKIKRLRRLLAAAQGGAGEAKPTAVPAGGANATPPTEAATLDGVLAQLAQRSATLQQQLHQLESRVAAVGGAPNHEAEPPSLRSRVEQLYRRGLPMEEIARRLDMNLAEVKVALELSRVAAR